MKSVKQVFAATVDVGCTLEADSFHLQGKFTPEVSAAGQAVELRVRFKCGLQSARVRGRDRRLAHSSPSAWSSLPPKQHAGSTAHLGKADGCCGHGNVRSVSKQPQQTEVESSRSASRLIHWHGIRIDAAIQSHNLSISSCSKPLVRRATVSSWEMRI